jgi:hypothetical protein
MKPKLSKWDDPAKRTPKPETMETPGDFAEFTENMRRLMKAKPAPKPSASRVPASS